jgi:outer membrane receptor protein involved in Fe transport
MQSNEAIVLKLTPWEFRLSHRYFSRRYTLPANTKWVASANIYNSVALVEFPLNGWKIRLSAGIDNLFDQEYFIITESPMPGRSYRLEASFEM